MPSPRVTLLLDRMRSRDDESRRDAQIDFWHHFVQPIRQLARRKMQNRELATADEEDVALSVFRVFFQGLGEGRFDSLASTRQTRALLTRLTLDKTIDLIRFHKAQRRNPSSTSQATDPSQPAGANRLLTGNQHDQVPDTQRDTADRLAEWQDELDRLVLQLSEQTLQRIVTLKLQGYSNDDIAGELGCATRTVERKLRMIRRFWGPIFGQD